MSKLGQQLPSTSSVLKYPRVTEKSTLLSTPAKGGPAYTFAVTPEATKQLVKAAVKKLYGLVPVKVHMITLPAKHFVYRGRPGRKTGLKKAVVYLKPGEKIDFV